MVVDSLESIVLFSIESNNSFLATMDQLSVKISYLLLDFLCNIKWWEITFNDLIEIVFVREEHLMPIGALLDI